MTDVSVREGSIAGRFHAWSLSRQFAVAGGLVMLAAATLAGIATSRIVTSAAIENNAASTALFMDSFLSPHVQGLANSDSLPESAEAALDRLLGSDAFEGRFPHLEIWKQGGLVAYSTTGSLIGRKFPPPAALLTALEGQVTAQYADLSAQEHVERQFSNAYLEIYAPVREHLSGKIIAVAEIHEVPDLLAARLFDVRLKTWLATAGLTFLVMATLFGIVYRGSRTIHEQQETLRSNFMEVEKVSEQNRILKERSQRASRSLAELNARYLRNVGAELHDGPAQLIGLAALKVEHIRKAGTSERRDAELAAMDMVLTDALRDIRSISKGLMLPEVEEMPLCGIIELVARMHEKRTDTKVAMDCASLGGAFPHGVKICVYRFVQEGLTNAFKHARGYRQAVACTLRDAILTVSVQDGGTTDARAMVEAGLGLTGLRARVESLGGVLSIRSNRSGGRTIEMSLDLAGGSSDG